MELILARDSINEILGYLSHQDLCSYGLSSKTCNVSAENEWRKRLSRYRETDSQCEPGWRRMFFSYLNEQNNIAFQYLTTSAYEKQKNLTNACDIVVRIYELQKLKYFKPTMVKTENTLVKLFYELDFECYETAKKYLEILFPKLYLRMLSESLFTDLVYESGDDEDEMME